MMRRKLIAGAIVIAPLLALGSVILVQRGRETKDAESAHPMLGVNRVNPPGELGEETECSSFAPVDFQYRIVNRSQQPISGLKFGTSCACEVLENPPAELLPGASALVGIRLRAPYAGRLHRKIPITIDGSSEPLLMLEVALRVKFEPPSLIPPPQELTLSFVKGDGSSRELVLETIEHKQGEPWLTGLDLLPPTRLKLIPIEWKKSLSRIPS